MKWLRALLTGILLWALIFFEVSILMFGLGLSGTSYYIIYYIALILLVLISSLVYFRRARGGILQGLLLGVVYVIVGIILDLIITIPLFVHDYALYYSNLGLWLGFLEVIILTSLFSLFLGMPIFPASKGSFTPSSKNWQDIKSQVTRTPYKIENTSPETSKFLKTLAKPKRKKKKR